MGIWSSLDLSRGVELLSHWKNFSVSFYKLRGTLSHFTSWEALLSHLTSWEALLSHLTSWEALLSHFTSWEALFWSTRGHMIIWSAIFEMLISVGRVAHDFDAPSIWQHVVAHDCNAPSTWQHYLFHSWILCFGTIDFLLGNSICDHFWNFFHNDKLEDFINFFIFDFLETD